jgi:outer membrane protein
MNVTPTLTFALFFLCALKVFSQAPNNNPAVISLSAEDVIHIAQEHSLASLYAKNLRENKYWMWRSYRANYLPQLSVTGSLPDFRREYTPVIQQDGTTIYRFVSNANSDLTLNINQSVGLTGGTFFIRSLLRRFDNFNLNHQYYYGGNPFEIGYQQSLFGFNTLLWDKKIEQLKYEESRKEYVEKLQDISIESTRYFYGVLMAQINQQIAERNRASNDTLYRITQSRYNLGKVGENELLQIELNVMTSQQALAQARLDLKTRLQELKNYIRMEEESRITLTFSDTIPDFEIPETLAIEQAIKNRSATVGFKRRVYEAESEVAQARGNNGLQANIFATYGFTNTAHSVPGMYNNPVDQQALRLGFTVPLLDWGRSQSKVKTSKANLELVKTSVEQEQITFRQNVFNKVNQFNMLKDQVRISRWSDKIAEKRYRIAKNLYLTGKLDVTNLTIAMREKDGAKREYIQTLTDFWVTYYEVRKLTLYDFQTMKTLVNNP